MASPTPPQLTERHQHEIAYHREHARSVAVLTPVGRRPKPWNHYGAAVAILRRTGVAGRRILVPGCGAGFDAIRFAQLGAIVTAVDLSPDMLQVAQAAAAESRTRIDFQCMAVESLALPSDYFDAIFIRDLLHHCEVGPAMSELVRVAKPGAAFVIDELYTHTLLQRARQSAFGRFLYSIVAKWIYDGQQPYITPDERKIDERELNIVLNALSSSRCQYWNTFVKRFLPDYYWAQVLDRCITRALGPLGRYAAGRVVITGTA